MKRIKHFKVLSIAVAFILVFSVVFPLSTRAENSSEEKFTAEQSINGTKVTVSADPEVFPEGTTMEVKEVNLTSTEDSLVASQQQADQKSIKKVALDITMKNKEGQEIEPDTSKGRVHVSFTNDDIKHHTTNVYHIDDNLKVESLKLTKSDDTVTGETTGFSTYVIDFTYDSNKVYYLYDNNTVDASTLLKTILGNNEAIEENKISNVVSDKTYITASITSGKWQVAADPNTTEDVTNPATITITYYDIEYTISLSYKKTDSNWIINFQRTIKGSEVTLTKFTGSVTSINIYPTAVIGGNTYTVKIVAGLFSKDTSPAALNLKEVSFIGGSQGVKTAGTDISTLFYNNSSVTNVDLSGLDTSNVTQMYSLFNNATALKSVTFVRGNIHFFNTSHVENMTSMFQNTDLETLDLSSFDTTSLTETGFLAARNANLKEINLSSFKGATTSYGYMPFGPLIGDTKLEKITLGSEWHSADNANYYALGIDGNWQNVQTSVVYTNEEIENSFTSSMAGTYIKTNLPPTSINRALYVADGYQKEQNMWEVHTPQDKFRAYCLDHQRLPPSGYFDKVEIDVNATAETRKIDANGHSNYIMDYLDPGNTGYKEIAPNMAKALVALIYYSDFNGVKGYNQNDIWHFTNDYSSGISAALQAKIDGKNTDGTSIGNKRTYDSIGKEYNLYIYIPSEYNTSPDKDKMQNLLSIEGATDRTYAGVQVKKVDNNSNGLFGAKFKVSKKDGSEIVDGKKSLEFTTNTTGIGGIYRMDRTSGLTVGTYILEEIEAPSGYLKNENNKFEFTVTDDDNQKVITVGNENKVIINNPIPNWHGGGLTLKKVDANTGAGLQNAEFTLYRINDDNTETEVNKYTTDSSGVLYTGNKELEIGKKYIIRETKAPDGYVNAAFSKEITLTASYENKYFDLGSIVNNPKAGSITLTAKKILKNSNETLKANQFTFQLYDSNHNKIGNPKGNAEDGTITFDPLNFTAADMPGKTYYIKEDIPTNADTSLDYDTHEERVQVLISDDGTDILKCTAQTDNDGITFVNTSKVNYNGKLTVNKIVKDSFGEVIQGNSGESFDFYLNLVSDTADLDTKTFNYTLDNKSGTFKLNKAGTTEDGKTKYRSQSSFKLSNGSKLELTLLPVGASYEVIEDDYSSNGYSTSVVANTEIAETDNTKNYQPTVDNAARKASGEISLAGDSITYTNSQQRIIPTSADSMTRMSFWILGTAGALVFVLILKRRLKASKK
ncbi:MAG: SpaA isopeptide-forming pilin-related protein [Sharpea porci]